MLNIAHLKADSFRQCLESLIEIPDSLVWILLNLLQFCDILRLRFSFFELFNKSFSNFIQSLHWSPRRNLYKLHEPIQCMTSKGHHQLTLPNIVILSLLYSPHYFTQELVLLSILCLIPMKYR